jgi:hypothetical protein
MPIHSAPDYEVSATISGENPGNLPPLTVWHSPVVSQIEVAQTLLGGGPGFDGDEGPAS